MDDREQSVQHFLDLIKRSQRGKFKVYIGMIAGVGKSYRMLQEAHELLENGVDVKIGYIETHGREAFAEAAGTDEEKEPVCLLYHRNEAGFVYIIIVFAADDCEVHHTVR